MALTTRDSRGNSNPLVASAVAVGINVTATGKEFEVAGNIVSRGSGDAGGTAIGFSTEPTIHGTIWTNASYDPAQPGKRWKRTMNFVDGNVGIGGSKDAVATAPAERLVVAGNILVTGDVRLAGADCAEDFAVADPESLVPGMVMVIGDDERLRQCREAYDKRVAGVLSGAGGRQPGIVLGRTTATEARLPLALAGTVYCQVDASYATVQTGDLLTTSRTPGHAMKAFEAGGRAFGAILGKALRPLTAGQGLIPVLIALH
jgi:hypothetical protein